MKKIFFLLILVALGCSNDKDENKAEPITIFRFDKELMSVKTEEELKALFVKNPAVVNLLFGAEAGDSAFVDNVFHMTQHADAQKLFNQTEETFGDLMQIRADFGRAFEEIKKLYPDYQPPRIVAGFSGLQNDMVVTDSLVIVSLDAFIGSKALFRPEQPDYILRRFEPAYIVPNVIRFLSNKFNKVDFKEDTFTDDMVFFGKSLEFSRQVLPHIADSLIIGYSNRELQNAYENQEYIWAHVIDKGLLNSNNPAVNSKYFGERPYVGEISGDCPGRIGQWLGWRVVELYRANNPDVSFQKLMETSDAGEILRGSKYRGQKD